MRRSRWVDWLLLGSLLPLFFAMLIGGIQAYRAAGERVLPFRLTGAQGASGYPIVLWLRTPQAEIRAGDSVQRLGEIDLQGLSSNELTYRTRALMQAGKPFAVEGKRGGARYEAEVEPVPFPSWWWPFPT